MEVQYKKYFKFSHLPLHLQGVSGVVARTADTICQLLPNTPDRHAGLLKLWEAKNLFVLEAVSSTSPCTIGDAHPTAVDDILGILDDLLRDNEHCCFELTYTKAAGWMVHLREIPLPLGRGGIARRR